MAPLTCQEGGLLVVHPKAAPYGSWPSPITAEVVTGAGAGIDPYMETARLEVDGPDVYWIEGRPNEAGRVVLVRRTPDGGRDDLTPAPFNVRSGVHSYGGGEFAVSHGVVVFEDFASGALYRLDVVPGEALTGTRALPRPLSPPMPSTVTAEASVRHADIVIDLQGRRVICVREDHSVEGAEAVTSIVCVPLDGPAAAADDELPVPDGSTTLVAGADFYSDARLDPEGRRLAWLSWDHPDMPWDGCELWVGDLDDNGCVRQRVRVAGGPGESILQPAWSPSGVLHFISDRSGWWNLYRWLPAAGEALAGSVEPLAVMEAEFGQVMWSWFGASTYAFLDHDRLACTYKTDGTWRLALLDVARGDDLQPPRLTPLAVPFTEIVQVRARPGAGEILFLGAAFDRSWSVVAVETTSGLTTVLHPENGGSLDARYLSRPQPVTFPTTDGSIAHGLFYAPRNPDRRGLEEERPPLIVQAHGGPTFAVSTALEPLIQYWTSRGLAFLDVAYGGSTGYGRAYRERLEGRWGEVDVDDCVSGASFLAERGLVDIERVVIQGGSAGGYTTLAALAFRDVFAGGASYYGISDLEALARETHKFESHYLDRLLAPYPEGADLYRERSPIHHLEGITRPVILFQGLADPVVPPNQAEMIVAELRERGVPVEYFAFEGEGHGFRRAETLVECLERQLAFYGEVLGFVPADRPEACGARGRPYDEATA